MTVPTISWTIHLSNIVDKRTARIYTVRDDFGSAHSTWSIGNADILRLRKSWNRVLQSVSRSDWQRVMCRSVSSHPRDVFYAAIMAFMLEWDSVWWKCIRRRSCGVFEGDCTRTSNFRVCSMNGVDNNSWWGATISPTPQPAREMGRN